MKNSRTNAGFGSNEKGATKLALLGLVFFAFLPLMAAVPLLHIGQVLSDTSILLSSLGRACGILGLSFLLLAALISVRLPGFDLWFGGLTRLWKIHHVLGAASFLLLMAHPLLLAFAAAPLSVQAAAAVLFPGLNAWSVWMGWLALAAMAVFLAPTFWFFGQPQYQRWKALHAVSGLALVLGVAHALPLTRSLPGAWGKFIWSGYGSLALLAVIYRLFLARRVARKRYTVTNTETAGHGIIEITLRPEERLLEYATGQFIYFTPLDANLAAGRNEEHPYTLSSAPREPVLRIAVKDAGDATHALQQVTLGSPALVDGPYGEFFPANKVATRELWIAGGIGLAPFLGRARALVSDQFADIDLIYCVQDETRAHFLAELKAISVIAPGFRVWTHYFCREGPLSSRFITACCPEVSLREIYLCGPSPLIAVARKELRRQGVPASHIHSEEFTWL